MTGYSVVEQEQPEILTRNLRVGAHIWASATGFFFIAFLFAYFYLRSLNEHAGWKPKGVDAPVGWGTAVMLCVVLAAGLLAWAGADQRADRRSLWRLKGTVALVLGLAAVVVQIVSWTQLGFGPTDGSFASVFLGWTGLYALFVLGSMFWLETILAVSFRYRAAPMGHAPVEPGHDIANPVDLNIAELAALTSYYTVLAAIGVVSWIVLYLI